jgi:hypothetical protein
MTLVDVRTGNVIYHGQGAAYNEQGKSVSVKAMASMKVSPTRRLLWPEGNLSRAARDGGDVRNRPDWRA